MGGQQTQMTNNDDVAIVIQVVVNELGILV